MSVTEYPTTANETSTETPTEYPWIYGIGLAAGQMADEIERDHARAVANGAPRTAAVWSAHAERWFLAEEYGLETRRNACEELQKVPGRLTEGAMLSLIRIERGVSAGRHSIHPGNETHDGLLADMVPPAAPTSVPDVEALADAMNALKLEQFKNAALVEAMGLANTNNACARWAPVILQCLALDDVDSMASMANNLATLCLNGEVRGTTGDSAATLWDNVAEPLCRTHIGDASVWRNAANRANVDADKYEFLDDVGRDHSDIDEVESADQAMDNYRDNLDIQQMMQDDGWSFSDCGDYAIY